jgi:hypothetical protein
MEWWARSVPHLPPCLLGRMTVWRLAPVRAGERYAVVGWYEGGTGRTLLAGSTIYAADATSVAVAKSEAGRPQASGLFKTAGTGGALFRDSVSTCSFNVAST